jgi:Nitrile hydratase beta subunit
LQYKNRPATEAAFDYRTPFRGCALWEKSVDAMMFLLIGKGVFTNDESRHHIETVGADAYERLTYYELWMVSIVKALQARGVITTDELGRKMAEVADRNTPQASPKN